MSRHFNTYMLQSIEADIITKVLTHPEIGNLALFEAILPMLDKFLNNQGKTSFITLVSRIQNPDILDILFSHDWWKNEDNLYAMDKDGNNILHLSKLNEPLLDKLVDIGIDINTKSRQGKTALMEVCSVSNPYYFATCCRIIEKMLKNGANINACDFMNNTALHYAHFSQGLANQSLTPVTFFLLQHGADFLKKYSDRPCFFDSFCTNQAHSEEFFEAIENNPIQLSHLLSYLKKHGDKFNLIHGANKILLEAQLNTELSLKPTIPKVKI